MSVLKNIFFMTLLFAFVPLTGFAQSQSEKNQAPKAKESDSTNKTEDKKEAPPKVKSAKSEKPTPEKTEKAKPDSTAKKEETKDSTKTPSKTFSNTEDKTKPETLSPNDKKEETNKSKAKPAPEKPASSSPKTTDSKSVSEDEVETLEVTGSYIRRSDVEGPSPIIVIDRKMIEKSGFNYVGQVLSRHTTVFPFASGGLRGLGGRQLVLVNGQRGVGINSIPITAVDRVEILTDGASATYGSDAMSGVINLITRKDWDGMEVATKFDTFEFKGNQTFLNSVSYGKNFSKGNVLTSLQHVFVTPLRVSDIKRLEFANDDWQYSTNYQTREGIKPGPGCPHPKTKGRDTFCEDPIGSQHISGPSHDLISLTDAEYKIGDLLFLNDSKLYSTLRLNYETSKSQSTSPFFTTPVNKKILGGRPGLGFLLSPGEVPSNWRQRLGINGAVKVYHRITEMPNQITKKDGFSYGLIAGLKGYLGSSDWIFDITLNNQFFNSQEKEENYALFNPVRQAVVNGTYDPFGSARNIDGFGTSLKNSERSQINWLEIKSSGDLGSLLGFDWASALGVNIAHFEFETTWDDKVLNRELLGFMGGKNTGGERQLYATFAELSGLYKNVEVQLAVRGDRYSDFGSTVNPKVAVMYQPFNWLGLRTSFSTGFIAPEIDQVQGTPTEGVLRITDPKACNQEGKDSQKCQRQYYAGRQGANHNLKEETSQNFNVGLVLSPLQNLNFSIDYWNITVNNIIGSPVEALLRLEAQGLDASHYGKITRGEPGSGEKVGRIEFIEAPLGNVAKNELHGVDFSGSFKMIDPFFKGSLALGSQFTYMFHFYENNFGSYGRQMILGRNGQPRWRKVTTLSYSLGPFSGQLIGRSFSKMEKYIGLLSREVDIGSIPGHTQFDISIDYIAPWGGRFQFGSINFFNDAPVYDDDNTYPARVNISIYKAERSWFLAYRHEF